jgi:manganese/iron transport system permease protein
VLFTKIPSDLHLDHILFGNLLGVGAYDLWLSGIIGGLVTLVLLVKWRDLVLFIFDPAQAHTLGLSSRVLHYGLLIGLALTIVATLQAAGIVLAVGLLIAPGSIAFLVTRRFSHMLVIAVAVTLVSAWAGITTSFWIDSASAPTMILFLTAFFIAAFIWRVTRNRKARVAAI